MPVPHLFGNESGFIKRDYLDENFAALSALYGTTPIGADPTGILDSTTALQSWLNTSSKFLYLPSGRYNFSSLVIPIVLDRVIAGSGVASVLVQTGSGITFTPNGVNCVSINGLIANLAFDGTLGSGNTLNTAFVQVLDLNNLYFNNVPVGFSSLKLDGNPIASVYMHDVRVNGLRIYSSTAGEAGVELGPWCSDTQVMRYICNMGFTTNYCIKANAQAQTTNFCDSHPYNAKINVVRLLGINTQFSWNNVIFDNALQDIFYQTSSILGRFVNCWFEAIPVGFSGVVFDASFNNNCVGMSFSRSGATALSCVREVNSSSGNKVVVSNIDAIGSFTTPFDLTGQGSISKGVQGYSELDTVFTLQGTSTSAQLQNTSTNLGSNGQNANLRFTAWNAACAGRYKEFTVTVDATPNAGQTFTFNLQKNGVTVASGVINNGQFISTVKVPNTTFSVGDLTTIQSVFSLTSGSTTPSYSVICIG